MSVFPSAPGGIPVPDAPIARPEPRTKPNWELIERITRSAAPLVASVATIIQEIGRILGWW